MTLTCHEVEALLLSDRPQGPASAAIDAHLASCPVCRRRATELGRIREVLTEIDEEPPPLVTRRVLARAREAAAERQRPPWLRVRPAVGLLAASLVAAIGLTLAIDFGSREPSADRARTAADAGEDTQRTPMVAPAAERRFEGEAFRALKEAAPAERDTYSRSAPSRTDVPSPESEAATMLAQAESLCKTGRVGEALATLDDMIARARDPSILADTERVRARCRRMAGDTTGPAAAEMPSRSGRNQ